MSHIKLPIWRHSHIICFSNWFLTNQHLQRYSCSRLWQVLGGRDLGNNSSSWSRPSVAKRYFNYSSSRRDHDTEVWTIHVRAAEKRWQNLWWMWWYKNLLWKPWQLRCIEIVHDFQRNSRQRWIERIIREGSVIYSRLFEGDRYIIELRSSRQAGYVALGLSDDDKMGKDSVVECVNESGSVKAYTSMTVVANGKFDSPRTGIVSLSFVY